MKTDGTMWAGVRYPHARLLIFAKAPVPGRVKTRLATTYGRRGAAVIYRQLLCQTLMHAVAAQAAPVELWVSPGRAHPWLAARAHELGVRLRVQPPGDLGRRMQQALRATLRRASFAALIGADCAALPPWLLLQAFDRLARGAQAVLGPAEDGGYVLVGLHRPQPLLFQAIPWSGPGVLAATRTRLRRLGLHCEELPLSFDIDRAPDLIRLRREYGSTIGSGARAKYPTPAAAAAEHA